MRDRDPQTKRPSKFGPLICFSGLRACGLPVLLTAIDTSVTGTRAPCAWLPSRRRIAISQSGPSARQNLSGSIWVWPQACPTLWCPWKLGARPSSACTRPLPGVSVIFPRPMTPPAPVSRPGPPSLARVPLAAGRPCWEVTSGRHPARPPQWGVQLFRAPPTSSSPPTAPPRGPHRPAARSAHPHWSRLPAGLCPRGVHAFRARFLLR